MKTFRATSTNYGLDCTSAYCRDCEKLWHGKGAPHRGRYHVETTGHTVDVYREHVSVVRPIISEEPI